MADLEEIVETHREGGTEDPADQPGEDQSTRNEKNASSRECKNSSDVDNSGDGSPPQRNRGSQRVDGNGGLEGQTVVRKRNVKSPGRDLRDKFYKKYHEEAKEYDEDFMKKYEENFDATLIFAGLFSTVTSAFIIEVNSQFQPDPNQETAALLRLILYNMNKTTFSDSIPTLPQPWTGPPRMIVEVQAILFASLAASLFAALLAVLGKQWLNRYEPVDVRGSAIDHSQNRQRKLDGIDSWYFDNVMELLPFMLQAALLLLGCALSRYLWEINTTVASVVLGVTSFGVLFYLFIVIAGATFVSCPYQTTGARVLRHIPDTLRHIGDIFRRIPGAFHHIPDAFRRVRNVFRHIPDTFHRIPHYLGVLHSFLNQHSAFYGAFVYPWDELKEAPHSSCNIVTSLFLILLLPIWLIVDVCTTIVWLLGTLSRRVRLWSQQEPNRQVAMLDQHCISWTLRVSLDGPVRLLALNYLATITPEDFDPTLAAGCFHALFDWIEINDDKATIAQGFEQLPTTSIMYCFDMLPHLIATPRVYEVVCQRHTQAIPPSSSFEDFQVLGIIHTELYSCSHRDERGISRKQMRWEDYKLSSSEHITVAHVLAKISQDKYRRSEKVPRWILRFALHSLSQSPLPPTSVVANSLSIVAIDLGYDSSTTATLDESAQLNQVSRWITQELEGMVGAEVTDARPIHPMLKAIHPRFKAIHPRLKAIHPRLKAINALLPYAVSLARDGQQGMANTVLRVSRALNPNHREFMWPRVRPYIVPLFGKPTTPSLGSIIILALYHLPWDSNQVDGDIAAEWATATSAVPYTEEVGQSVVDTLLQIASVDSLRPRIPIDIWAYLKRRPSPPPEYLGRWKGIQEDVVRHVRALGDIEILKSYFLFIWSEWYPIEYPREPGPLREMLASIREDFDGVGMWRHRKELINRLDHILGQLDLGLKHLRLRKPSLDDYDVRRAKEQYGELKKLLLEVDGKDVNILTQSCSTFMCALPPPCL